VTSAVITTYDDPILGITFLAPAGLVVTRAEPGAEGQTTQAIFNTYSNPNGADLSRELSITASIVRKGTNDDLRAFAARGFPGSYTVIPLAGRNGIVLEGDFQSGPRKFVLIERGPDHVLVISAFPRNSSRIAIFDQLLATLVVR
jgi:hypothetical protein